MYNWCFELNKSIPQWLSSVLSLTNPGYIKYCRDGHVFKPSLDTGLGASSLALKLVCQLNLLKTFNPEYLNGWIEYINHFQDEESGLFEDKSLLAIADKKNSSFLFKRKDYNFRRAETRQACAALLGASSLPRIQIKFIPEQHSEVEKYLRSLPWDVNPWSAGSHASHLVFFLFMNANHFANTNACKESISLIFDYFDNIRDHETGSWHTKPVRANQQINAAMKVLTAYSLLGKTFEMPEKLIDLCLDNLDSRDACHSLDVIYVLYQCRKLVLHRENEIACFAADMLELIRKHKKSDGALSFFPEKANTNYYGVIVSRGFDESDIQGTHLLTWGIAICADILGFGDDLEWKMPIT